MTSEHPGTSAEVRTLLPGLRVVDVSTEIAGPYATKLLADAGADVVKVEPAAGDPLRRWSASHVDLGGRDGRLFTFLNASKRSLVGSVGDTHVDALLAEAHVLVESGAVDLPTLASLRRRHPHLVLVSVTPFGRSGPWADRVATEFTLQALCGSTGTRGTRDREPLHAGGRLGEWISGTYAAVGAVAALLGGRGEHVDVSMLECMLLTLGGYGALFASLAGALDAMRASPGPFRSVELPSIERTADGLVGFCTVTGQQFADLVSMIDRSDLVGDPRFATAPARMKHEREFSAILGEWLSTRSTAEVVQLSSLLRIPVTAVGEPSTITEFDHFVERGVFVGGPGGFTRPRPPYRVTGLDHRPFAPAPDLDEHAGARWRTPAWVAPTGRETPPGRPLAGLRIVDLTAFWAGPSAGAMLAALGADVVHVESVQRPDGMRFASSRPPSTDGWWEWSAYYQANNANKRGITLDLNDLRGRELFYRLAAESDAVIENFSPRVLDGFGISWEELHRRSPRTTLVRMPAFGLDGPWRDRTGFAQTMEQVGGLAWLTGFPDGLPIIPRGACDPLAGMHAVYVLLATLAERDRSGEGRLVELTMVEAALNAAAEVVIEQSAYGRTLHRDGNRGPVAAPQGVYACAGVERWLALAVRSDEEWRRLRDVLGEPAWAAAPDFDTTAGRRAGHHVLDKYLVEAFAERDLQPTVEALLQAGVPAAPVLGPAAALEVEQLSARGFVETIDGPVVGTHACPGVPFRLASRPGAWFDSPAPTLGQHNDEVLGGLGLTAGELADLRRDRVIGDRPGGRS